MCGIIGYVGEREATPILMESLKRLEYRGYDSAGVAVMETDIHSTLTKSERKVDDLIAKLTENMPKGRLGIGHTRWATHGKPTIVNAHPHSDCYARIMVVHNGIIENFQELKEELEAKGHEFTSETDSEVIPHLVEDLYQGDLLSAVRQALQKIKGAYAIALYSHDDPELLIGARLNAPLVVGMGEGEWFLASDITAIIPYTKRVLVLGEGEIVAISPVGPQVTTLDGVAVEPKVISVDWDVSQAQKGGFEHFMLKEIQETPEAAANVLRGRIQDDGAITFNEFSVGDEKLNRIRNVKLLGMGTSLHAAMLGEYVIEDWAGIPAKAEDASEFRYRRPMLGEDSLAVIVTQSGETADTIMGMRQALERGALTVAITNVVGSTAARDAQGVIYLQAGPEIGVASTKTFVSHAISHYLLAMRLAASRHRLSPERLEELVKALRGIPEGLRAVLAMEPRIRELALKYAQYRNFMFTGRGINYPIALEGALKLKEISYLHAEGASGGELKHGPIALLDASFPVVALATNSPTREKMISNIHEMAARDAPVLALVTEGDHSADGVAADLLFMPPADEAAGAVLNTVALQLFAYHVAVALGTDVDQPRNLAKSVTVE
ncbi:MAG TPA: glutamine--fructose-6-phosphate transaminase (isomerizing) [Candidatus Dormibacteraeota bacterium]|nr:glutamine--fructose-6-phosphate transaminase (isomerizing) [Candidatus Dormibacteraeota bacterium]